MSFTQDELQAFNNILELRLAVQRRELERIFELRLQLLKRDMEQRFTSMHQDLLRDLASSLSDQQQRMKEVFYQQLDVQQSQQLESLQAKMALWQERLERLIRQREPAQFYGMRGSDGEVVDIEVEGTEASAEITWEYLMGSLDKVIDKRSSALLVSIQVLLKEMERNVLEALQQVCEESVTKRSSDNEMTALTDLRDVVTSLEQLEQLVESMQVTMTANHALLSNRLYRHRQLSCEQAHPVKSSVGAGEQIVPAQEEENI
jgi:ribosomal protein L21E